MTGAALLRRKGLRAKVLWAGANGEMGQGDNILALQKLKEAIALCRETGDLQLLGYCLQNYYLVSTFIAGEDGSAAAEEGLAILEQIGDRWGLAQAYLNMGRVAFMRGDLIAREAYVKKAFALEGNSTLTTALDLLGMGMSERYYGQPERARKYFQEGRVLFHQLRFKPLETVMLSELGHVARQTGDFEQALEIYKQTIMIWQELGSRAAVANQLETFAFVYIAQNQLPRAAKLLGAAEALREKINAPMTDLEEVEYHQSVNQLRSLLEAGEFDDCWATGRAMTMDQAIRLALE